MFYYDENGDMSWTTDRHYAERHHVRQMLTAARYPLSPESIGRLHEVLGPAPKQIARDQAMDRIRSVLRQIGHGDVPVSDVIQSLNREWRMLVTVGRDNTNT